MSLANKLLDVLRSSKECLYKRKSICCKRLEEATWHPGVSRSFPWWNKRFVFLESVSGVHSWFPRTQRAVLLQHLSGALAGKPGVTAVTGDNTTSNSSHSTDTHNFFFSSIHFFIIIFTFKQITVIESGNSKKVEMRLVRKMTCLECGGGVVQYNTQRVPLL